MKLNLFDKPTLKNQILPLSAGVVAGSLVDALVIDQVVAKMGVKLADIAYVIKDASGNYVWGIAATDIANGLIGVGLMVFGAKKNKPQIKYFGLGWALSEVANKIGELYLYYGTGKPGDWAKTAGYATANTSWQRTSVPAQIAQPTQGSKYIISG